MTDEKEVQIGWRIPAKLKASLDAIAKAERRTVNAQAVMMLEQAVELRSGYDHLNKQGKKPRAA